MVSWGQEESRRRNEDWYILRREGEGYIYLLSKGPSPREYIMIMLMIAASRAIATPDTTRVAGFDSEKRFRE